MKNGARIFFPISFLSTNARAAAPTSISDRYGNVLTLERDSNSNLKRIASPSGRYLQFVYDTHNRITQASDNIGRTTQYEYDAAGHLAKATDPDGKSKAYTYDLKHNMLTVQDARGNSMVSNVYDANSRVSKQTYADGSTNLFSYGLDAAGKVTRTDITDERGIVTRMLFNSQGYTTSVTKAYGRVEQQVVAVERDPATNLMLSRTDALGRKTSYTYDGNGNLLTRTLLAGTPDAVTIRMSYTADFNYVASVTDFLGHQSTMRYDERGNLIETRDANGIVVKRSYNSAGQLTQVNDGLGNSTSLAYDVFDLARVTDPLSRTVQFYVDAAGRVRSVVDALGNRSSFDVDVLDRVTRSTDPLGQPIGQDFDANSNPTGLTDPKGNLHKFVFDKRNVLTGNIDPLNKAEIYAYDAKHNLTQKTDRKGQVTRYAYDVLDRLTSTTYADGGTVTVTYDQGNRIVRMDDSVNGIVSFDYDVRDRVGRVSTPKGKVAYTYDANGRRASMSVTGLPPLRYSYDDGGRLVRIEQAADAVNNGVAQSISFVYDAANRRIRTSYANGVTRSDTYDGAGQLVSIAYANADGSVLGDLRYAYDNGGRRIQAGGSLAHAALPEALASANVDAANRLTVFGAQTLSYDANGNLLGDGDQTYVWNARDQLIQINSGNGAVVASFSYDALGRRQTKTVNGVASGYVYDGLNIVQELSGLNVDNSSPANVRASYISGGIDEVFVQLSGTGAGAKISTYLSDALGSTVRLVDAAGNKMVDYAYDPYGRTTADTVVDNSFQYTGRENDGTGLYFYRTRYYSPSLGRFISSDQIGLNGGINTYAYVGGDPVFRTDPLGENWNKVIPIIGCLIGLCNNPIIPSTPPNYPPPVPGQAPKPGTVSPNPKTLPKTCPADKTAGTPTGAPPANARPQPNNPNPPVVPPVPPVLPNPWLPLLLIFVPGNMFQNPFPSGNEIN
ncbi:RHS repeat-associated core domain-containing protein [Rugamonas sp. CCM 8940]|uniref:RHS repeat domain-containing protein n=1 Tax=Rugamonas sp. CCM 8940 TaxID=2765359 RepID=UPI0018F32275|nr:RHS repeat domain-containing protein [Rugamonas sp. CCM 8940]MBJ7309698.1 RHS repeat protein [Rugamonas sp. CCM 8940]